jgi:tetratricopeptide (TPR) repeat protein
VDGNDGTTLWVQDYGRPFHDVLAVQEEIARAVAGELGLRFDRSRQLVRHNTRSVDAYQMYLRGWDPLLLRSEAGVWKAMDFFRQAIAIDSTYAAAHAGMALMYVRRARNARDPQLSRQALLDLSKESARHALRLDSTLAEAHYALAQVHEASLEFGEAERAIRRAIALDPSRSVYRRRLAYLHGWAGRPEAELQEARLALEIDPLNPYAIGAYAGALFGVRRDDEAMAELERLSGFQPPLQAAAFILAQIYVRQGRWDEAIGALRPMADAGDPLYVALFGFVLGRAGERDEANRILDRLLARRNTDEFRAFQVALVYAGLGDLDQTFFWLQRSIDDNSISSLVMGPTFEFLHADSRFAALRARLGLAR